MTAQMLLWNFLFLLISAVPECEPVCVDAVPDTEAVVGNPMKLICVSCIKREIEAETRVHWYYRTNRTAERHLIFVYDGKPQEVQGPWMGRLQWNGSKDNQDLSIGIIKVTLNDSGRYECVVHRQFSFNLHTASIKKNVTVIDLVVREKASQDSTALYSEIMMYVLLVFLTLWLLIEMIYCYRKISKSEEQPQDSATDYLAIPSDTKENPGPAVTEQ